MEQIERHPTVPTVYEYSDPLSYLRDVLSFRQKKNPSFSIRSWARQLKVKNSSTLWRVLQGQRGISEALLDQLSDNLQLNSEERLFLESLVAAHEGHRDFGGQLKDLRYLAKASHKNILEDDQLHLISEWYHFAILEMTALKDFQADPEWISKRLGSKVPAQTCWEAVERLLRLGLLEESENGEFVRGNPKRVYADGNGHRSEAIRNVHRQMIRSALESVDGQDVQQRTLMGSTLAIRHEDLSEANRIIADAHAKLCALSRDSGADAVYHFSSQLFQLSSDTAPTHDGEPQ